MNPDPLSIISIASTSSLNIITCICSLWSSGQSSWLQIQRSRVRFPALPDFLRVVSLEWGPLSVMIITEELPERKSSGSGSRKSRLTVMGICCSDHATPPIHKSRLYLRWQATVGIVHLWTKAMKFNLFRLLLVLAEGKYAMWKGHRQLIWTHSNCIYALPGLSLVRGKQSVP
jgi:hypothetical protein